MLDRQQGTLERFTVGGGFQAVWSPDGSTVAVAKPDGLYIKRADGSGDDQLVLRGQTLSLGSWLPDNRSIVFQAGSRPNTLADIGLVTLGDSTPRWLVETEFFDRHPQVSRDGRWLAYSSTRTGQPEVFVQPLSGDGARVQVSTEGGTSPRWSPDGRIVYYVAEATIMAATRAPGTEFAIASRRAVVSGGVTDVNGANVNWDLHPNGREFLFIDQSGGSGVQLVWIQNWKGLLRSMGAAR
jgi:Tol biopolymer transport system component